MLSQILGRKMFLRKNLEQGKSTTNSNQELSIMFNFAVNKSFIPVISSKIG